MISKEFYHQSKLCEAIRFASLIHEDQRDKMDTIEEMIIAVLHDVLEDGNCEAHYDYISMLTSPGERLEIHLYPATINSLLILRKVKSETYDEYINRVKKDRLARKIKIEDLKDNMNLIRIKNPDLKDFERYQKYRKALDKLVLYGS